MSWCHIDSSLFCKHLAVWSCASKTVLTSTPSSLQGRGRVVNGVPVSDHHVMGLMIRAQLWAVH